MKKLLCALFSVALTFSFAACGSGNSSSGISSSAEISASVATSEHSDASAQELEQEAPLSGSAASTPAGGTLVAYFSWSGNTRQMAEIIAQETGADLFEITVADPYPDDYNTLLDIAQQEQRDAARPALSTQVENWDRYDTVFLGYPCWWGDAPMAVYTFLESYDCTGKVLIPFNTSASSGFGASLTGISESAPDATVLDGLSLTEAELEHAADQIAAWLDDLELNG